MHAALGLLVLTVIGADEGPAPPVLPKIVAPRLGHDDDALETWQLSLPSAIRLGLDNCESAWLISLDGSLVSPFGPGRCAEGGAVPVVIARVNADADLWRFKAEIMALVRSIEQQYWSLAQQHAQLWACEKAVELGEGVLKREQSELKDGRGTVADVAESQQRLEQFRLDLVTKTSDIITTERQLRNLLGLPPADSRRIVPVTSPVEARVEPDWDDCRTKMRALQPDIVLQQEAVRSAEWRCLLALGKEMLAEALGLPSLSTEASTQARQALDTVDRQRAFLKQVIHQTTHSLARFRQEIDTNYQQYQTAQRLRAAAAQRLDAQRAFYEEGRITVDRYLDAISQYAAASATEAQYKTSYNIAIVALEEAKGSLLAHDNITVAEGPRRVVAIPAQGDQAASDRSIVKAVHEAAPSGNAKAEDLVAPNP